jgi:hypothetical protein
MFASSGATVLAEKGRVNYIRIVQRWNSRSRIRCDEIRIKHGSRVTAIGIQGAGFEQQTENCGGCFRALRLEFAQGVHRLRTVLGSRFSVLGSQFSVLSVLGMMVKTEELLFARRRCDSQSQRAAEKTTNPVLSANALSRIMFSFKEVLPWAVWLFCNPSRKVFLGKRA